MRAVIQRVSRSSVSADGQVLGETGPGLVLLVGVTESDTQEDVQYIVEKTANMRLFPAEGESAGFDRSALEVRAGLLLVSQFTLYASTRKGRRPSFMAAASGDIAEPMFDSVVEAFRDRGLHVFTGAFGAQMSVEIVNDGPVTILLDSADRQTPRRSAS